MKTQSYYILFFAVYILSAIGCLGCLDLSLLDEMNSIDKDSDNPSNNSENTKTESVTPELNPNDNAPPEILMTTCSSLETLDKGICIATGPVSIPFRFTSNEPASVSIKTADNMTTAVISSKWTTLHHAVVAGISFDNETELEIVISDVNGNEYKTSLAVKANGKSPVVITEVLADPRGTEPNQEFIEIINIGDKPIDLSNWMIDDNGDQNGDLIPAGTILEAGRVGILVAPSFDSASAEDPAPAPNTLIIKLTDSIGIAGLKNSEAESVELYNADGDLISFYDGNLGAPKLGISASRLYAEIPDGNSSAFVSASSTPGMVPRLK